MTVKKRGVKSILGEAAMLGVCIIFFIPFYYLLVNTFKPAREATVSPLSLPVKSFTLDLYRQALNTINFWSSFRNSILITVVSVVIIISIGSMASYFGCTTVPAYTATKGAVAQLTKSVAVDCAGRGININCICPGYMDTEMCANMTQERKDECTKRIPAGRWGLPEDMKGPVVFLASAASDYLNGALIPVDGGYLVK